MAKAENHNQHNITGKLLPVVLLPVLASLMAQAQEGRGAGTPDPSLIVQFEGSYTLSQSDRGPAEPAFKLPYITLMLKPRIAQQIALRELLARRGYARTAP
jgi:hypothetical protein